MDNLTFASSNLRDTGITVQCEPRIDYCDFIIEQANARNLDIWDAMDKVPEVVDYRAIYPNHMYVSSKSNEFLAYLGIAYNTDELGC